MPSKATRAAKCAPGHGSAEGRASKEVEAAAAENVCTEQKQRQGRTKTQVDPVSDVAPVQQPQGRQAGAAGVPQEAGPTLPAAAATKQQPDRRKAAVTTAVYAALTLTSSEPATEKASQVCSTCSKTAAAAADGEVHASPGVLPKPALPKARSASGQVTAGAAAAVGIHLVATTSATKTFEVAEAAPAAAVCKLKYVCKPVSETADAAASSASAAAAAITVTVATWNVKHFTCVQGTAAHLQKLSNIVQDIIRSGADIVVLQEVDQDRAVTMLCAELMRLGALRKGDKGWCYALSNPLAPPYAERGAFVWRHGSKVRLVGVKEETVAAASAIHNMHGRCSAFSVWEGSQPDHPSSMGLKRAIYTGNFSVCNTKGTSKAQLCLCSVHIDPGQDKTIELGSRLPLLIEQMWEGAAAGPAAVGGRKRRSKDPFLAVLGDFNRDAGHSDFARLADPAGCRLCPLLQPGVATNISGNAQYDNAWVPAEQRRFWSAACVLAPPAEVAALPVRQAVSRYPDHRMVCMVLTLAMHADDGGRRL